MIMQSEPRKFAASIWMAQLERPMNNVPYHFSSLHLSFTTNGPKSGSLYILSLCRKMIILNWRLPLRHLKSMICLWHYNLLSKIQKAWPNLSSPRMSKLLIISLACILPFVINREYLTLSSIVDWFNQPPNLHCHQYMGETCVSKLVQHQYYFSLNICSFPWAWALII